MAEPGGDDVYRDPSQKERSGVQVAQVADDLYAADRHEFAFEWTEPDGVPVDE